MIPALVQPLRKRESIVEGRLLANDKSGMWEMVGAASAPQKGWSDVGGFRMSPKWIGGKKNAAEKEGVLQATSEKMTPLATIGFPPRN